MKPNLESPFLIAPVSGYSGAIGHLVSMMSYTRRTTLAEAEGLSTSHLDFLMDDTANSIGMLLEHIAGVEEWYQESTFGWEFSGEELERRELGGNLGEEARGRIRGSGLTHYLERLVSVRDRTLRELARRDDAWLFEEDHWNGRPSNNYFKWFHVFEDELNHRGQIRLIRKRLPEPVSSRE
ncbi:MAG: DUF664 domain-containing protein [Trueperaceae bacterium]